MSMQKKLDAAAYEAVIAERARCLWCVDQVVAELKAQLDTKLLASTAEIHGRQLKFNIARALAVQVRATIASGVGPGGSTSAGVSPGGA